MKKIILFVWIVVSLVACTTKETVLDFNLAAGSNNNIDSASVIFNECKYPFALDKMGHGRLTMNIDKDGFALLAYGKMVTDIYLKRGNELKITTMFEETMKIYNA